MTDPHGQLIWTSDGLPSLTHDLSAAHVHGVFGMADRTQLYLYTDKGYIDGKGLLLTPDKGRHLPNSYRDANRYHAAIRANGERGFVALKSWKIFDRFRSFPCQVDAFARAVLTLEHDPEQRNLEKARYIPGMFTQYEDYSEPYYQDR